MNTERRRGVRQQGTSMPQNKVATITTLFPRGLRRRSPKNTKYLREPFTATPHMPDRLTRWRHLSQLGWTQQEIADRLEVDQKTVSNDRKNCHLAKIPETLPTIWNEQLLEDTAKRLNVPHKDLHRLPTARYLDGP